MGRKSFVPVLQCRFCGSIVTSEAGAKSHGTECRHLPVLNGAMKISPMVAVKFPCPVIFLKKIEIEPESKVSRFMGDNKLPRRKSSLRAPQKLQLVVKSESKTLPKDKELDLDSKSKRLIKNKKSAKEDEWVVPTWDKGNIKLLKKPYYRIQGQIARSKVSQVCKYCGITVRRDYLKSHVKLKHTDGKINIVKEPENPFPCPFPECGSKLKYFWILRSHFIYHLENNPYRCTFPKCSFRSDAMSHLVRHMYMHIGEVCLCPMCHQELPWVGQVRRHKDCSKENSEGLLDEKAFTKKDFELELDKIKKSRKYFSDLVQQSIGRVDINAIYTSDPVFIRVAAENPEFQEQILEYMNKQKRFEGLPREKILKCEKCPKMFVSKAGLRAHTAEIHLPRPYKCPTCFRTYRGKVQLDAHVRGVHESKLPNNKFMIQLKNGKSKCTKCGAENSSAGAMKRHWLLIHKIQLPKFCSKAAANRKLKLNTPKDATCETPPVSRNGSKHSSSTKTKTVIQKAKKKSFDLQSQSSSSIAMVKVEKDLDLPIEFEKKPIVGNLQAVQMKTDLDIEGGFKLERGVKREKNGFHIVDYGSLMKEEHLKMELKSEIK